MFAVIQTGGKQYKVAKNSVIKIEKIEGAPGAKIEFNQILMIGEDSKASVIGTPIVKGALVTAEIMEQVRANKIIIFKKKRRQNYRRKAGHKQELTELKIIEITKK
jgi:large subunit ribosomal protein L21